MYNDVLDITNNFYTPGTVKYMKKKLIIATNFASPLALRYDEVPFYQVRRLTQEKILT